jgi:hypothetical protein
MIAPRKFTLDEAAELLRLPHDRIKEHCGPNEWSDEAGLVLSQELIERIATAEGVNL